MAETKTKKKTKMAGAPGRLPEGEFRCRTEEDDLEAFFRDGRPAEEVVEATQHQEATQLPAPATDGIVPAAPTAEEKKYHAAAVRIARSACVCSVSQ